jgi:hypothetical protein
LLVGILVALDLALPALVLGLLLVRLTRGWRWSVPLWLGLTALGLGLFALFALHGFEPLLTAQMTEVVRDARLHQANLLAWDRAQLWARTWPVWLRTCALFPAVATWRLLATRTRGGGEAELRTQERARQRMVTRAQRNATRRLRSHHRVPDAIGGHMFIGIPIEDDANA